MKRFLRWVRKQWRSKVLRQMTVELYNPQTGDWIDLSGHAGKWKYTHTNDFIISKRAGNDD